MSDPTFYIETPRLYLSYFLPTSLEHCSFLVTLYNSPLFISSEGKTEITNPHHAQERLQNQFLAEHKRNGYGQYLVSLKTTPIMPFAESKPIGSVSLMRGDSKESYTVPDIGFAIVPEMNGKGYATESAKALLEYAKRELGVVEVLGFCGVANIGSKRVMKKIGMEDRGVKHLAAFGGAESAVYALLGMKSLKEYGID